MHDLTVKNIYICIATRQNTINALPFFHDIFLKKEIDEVFVIETDQAKELKWSSNLCVFLNNYLNGKSNINIFHENEIVNIVRELRKKIKSNSKNSNTNTYINIGGGTKSMILQIYQMFYELKNPLLHLLYPNIETNFLEIFNYQDPTIEPRIPSFEKMKVDISIEKVLNCFGKELININHSIEIEIQNHFSDKSFREYLYIINNTGHVLEEYIEDEYEREIASKAVTNIHTSVVSDAMNKLNSLKLNEQTAFTNELKTLLSKKSYNLILYPHVNEMQVCGIKMLTNEKEFGQKFLNGISNKTGKYFELIIQSQLKEFCEENNIEIGFNIKLEKENKLELELDATLNLKNGELLNVECKTVDFKKKDAFSRIKNIDIYSGVYGKMITIFPYFFEDFENAEKETDGSIKNKYLNTLRKLPQNYKDKEIDFIIFDNIRKPYEYYLKNENNNFLKLEIKDIPQSKSRNSIINEGFIHIRNLQYFLNQIQKTYLC